MSRLIDTENLDFVSYQGVPDGYKDSFDSGVLYAMNLIDEQQTIDAVPVVHGHWEDYLKSGLKYRCSFCKSRFNTAWEYCPHCGAKMDEVTE